MQLDMEIPEDLRLLASHEQEFKEMQFKKEKGIKEDNQSTMLLREALAAGQKSKKGIGFKAEGAEKKKQGKSRRYSDDEDLIDKYKEMIDDVKLKEFQLKSKELHGGDNAVCLFYLDVRC